MPKKYVLPHTGLYHNSSATEKLKIAAAVTGTLILGPLYLGLCVYGPLWPVGRLILLREGHVAAAAEGIHNMEAQRMFSRVALLCLAILAAYVVTFYIGVQYTPLWHVAMAMVLGLYLYVTIVVFESAIGRGLHAARYYVAAILLALAWRRDVDDPDDGPTPQSRPTGNAVGAIAGIVCMAAFLTLGAVFAGIYVFDTAAQLFASR